jgi:hypothetical protein
LQALGVNTDTTRLIVSNLGNVFDKLLLFNDLFRIVGDLIYIAMNMPIPAAQITGVQVPLMGLFRA